MAVFGHYATTRATGSGMIRVVMMERFQRPGTRPCTMRRHLAIAGACALLVSCGQPDPTQPSTPLLAKIRSDGKLRVVTQASGASYFLGPQGPVGPEYELAQRFADVLGVKLEMYAVDSLNAVYQEIIDGRADLAAAHLTMTPSRAEVVRFGPAYQQVSHLVLYHKGSRRPRRVDDLPGRQLEVVSGSGDVAVLTALQSSGPDLRWTEVPEASVDSLLEGISNGRIDVAIADSATFEMKSGIYPDVNVGFELTSADSIAWAFRKDVDSSLYDEAQEFFADLQDGGELQALLAHYYEHDKRFDKMSARGFIEHVETRLPSYRSVFEEVAQETGIEWRLLAAMAYQESHWDPAAVSPTGVRGMMMITEATASDLGLEDREDVRQSVLGGARYFLSVKRKIPKRIHEPDRTFMALAAYNVGFGHLEDARVLTQMQGKNPDSWREVREHLPLLSDERWYSKLKRGYARGTEPVKFVRNIRSYYDILQWMAPEDSDDLDRPPEKRATRAVVAQTSS